MPKLFPACNLDEIDATLARVFEAAECRTQVELAEFMGIRQSSISDAKRRGSIPAEWLIKILRIKQVNPDWILNGEGPRLLQPSECKETPVQIRYITETRPPAQCSAEELFNELVRRALSSIV